MTRTSLVGESLRAALRAKATFSFVRHDEDQDPDGAFSDPADAAWVREQLRAGNGWAWFVAEVRATFGGLTGRDTLGACSYRSEDDFLAPGGYYDDMCTEAINDLAIQIESVGAAVEALRMCGAPVPADPAEPYR